MKRKRTTKDKISKKDFICDMCFKSYLSYPALYTHKRNKHSLIPLTTKSNIFKQGNAYCYTKFKNNIDKSQNKIDKHNVDRMIDSLIEQSVIFYTDPTSVFYKPNYNYKDHSFIKLLKVYQDLYVSEEELILKENLNDLTIMNALASYSLLLLETSNNNGFCNLLVNFVILLIEYLNMYGWDHFINEKKYGIKYQIKKHEEFCKIVDCREIPDFIDEFLSIFMKMDERYIKFVNEFTDLGENFCLWLLNNEYTNYKLIKL